MNAKLRARNRSERRKKRKWRKRRSSLCFSALLYLCRFMEIGVYTFADLGTHPVTKGTISPRQRIMNLLEEIELADQLGLEVFAVGEHHRPDYLVSSPGVVLGAAAVKTKNIKLSSAVTVLSSDDPVRVFQQFAEVDLLSGGRAESWPAGVRLSNLFLCLVMILISMMPYSPKNLKCF